MKRSIWFWLYFITSIILAIYFATRVIMVCTGRSQLSYVKNIIISTDTPNKDLNPIITAAAITSGTQAYKINLDEINDRIMATPGIKNSATRRLPSGNLIIHVDLYQAVAQWTDGNLYYPLSDDGTIVNNPTDIRNESTVIFRGNVPDDISMITDSAHNMVDKIKYMEYIEDRRWNIYTTTNITVMLPEKNPIEAIDRLITLDKTHNILSKDIRIIDMRDASRILVR